MGVDGVRIPESVPPNVSSPDTFLTGSVMLGGRSRCKVYLPYGMYDWDGGETGPLPAEHLKYT